MAQLPATSTTAVRATKRQVAAAADVARTGGTDAESAAAFARYLSAVRPEATAASDTKHAPEAID